MKLKTLKDMKEQDWSTHKGDIELVNAVFFDIKEEAIKWIKALESSVVRDLHHLGKIRWIKEFFNITEEDLK